MHMMQSVSSNGGSRYRIEHDQSNDLRRAETPAYAHEDSDAQLLYPWTSTPTGVVQYRGSIEEQLQHGRSSVSASTSPHAPAHELPYYLSSTFHWNAVDVDGNAPDLDLIAWDGVHFAAHLAVLDAKSCNRLGGLLDQPTAPAIAVPLTSAILNIILHAIYGLSPAQFSPTLDELGTTPSSAIHHTAESHLATAVEALEQYGLSKTMLVSPATPLFQLFLRHAPAEPLACYALAAHAGLDKLAVVISPYTLSLTLSDISDASAAHIGPYYLKRLFFLHVGRVDALKRLLFPPPSLHPPTDKCSLRAQRQLSSAWTMTVANMTWTLSAGALLLFPPLSPMCLYTPCARAGMTVSMLEKHLGPIEKDFDCHDCTRRLHLRIRDLLVAWSLVKVRSNHLSPSSSAAVLMRSRRTLFDPVRRPYGLQSSPCSALRM